MQCANTKRWKNKHKIQSVREYIRATRIELIINIISQIYSFKPLAIYCKWFHWFIDWLVGWLLVVTEGLRSHRSSVWPSLWTTLHSTSVEPWPVRIAVCSTAPYRSPADQSETDETSLTLVCRRWRSRHPLEDTGWPWCGLERNWSEHKRLTTKLQNYSNPHC